MKKYIDTLKLKIINDTATNNDTFKVTAIKLKIYSTRVCCRDCAYFMYNETILLEEIKKICANKEDEISKLITINCDYV